MALPSLLHFTWCHRLARAFVCAPHARSQLPPPRPCLPGFALLGIDRDRSLSLSGALAPLLSPPSLSLSPLHLLAAPPSDLPSAASEAGARPAHGPARTPLASLRLLDHHLLPPLGWLLFLRSIPSHQPLVAIPAPSSVPLLPPPPIHRLFLALSLSSHRPSCVPRLYAFKCLTVLLLIIGRVDSRMFSILRPALIDIFRSTLS